MIEIIPSILTDKPIKLEELLGRCEGIVERVSIDIIDGKFAENKTIEPDLLKDIDTDLRIDYQLMVEEPVKWVEKCVRGQADRIIGQVEKMSDQSKFIQKVQEVGCSVGFGLDLTTPITAIDPEFFTDLDVVLVMSVPAGFGGQEFDTQVLDKINELRRIREENSFDFKIQDDGGVTLERIDDAHFMGADEVSVGRRIFKGDLRANIVRFQKSAHNLDLSK